MTDTKRLDIEGISEREPRHHMPIDGGPLVVLTPEERDALCAYALELEKQLSICNGTFKGEMDGKPVLGNIMDGTDAACPGWWRGMDYGCKKMEEKYKERIDALVPAGKYVLDAWLTGPLSLTHKELKAVHKAVVEIEKERTP